MSMCRDLKFDGIPNNHCTQCEKNLCPKCCCSSCEEKYLRTCSTCGGKNGKEGRTDGSVFFLPPCSNGECLGCYIVPYCMSAHGWMRVWMGFVYQFIVCLLWVHGPATDQATSPGDYEWKVHKYMSIVDRILINGVSVRGIYYFHKKWTFFISF